MIYKLDDFNVFPKTNGVYSISFLNSENNKSYIGSASRKNFGFHSRWKRHIFLLEKGVHHSKKLQNAYNKYGGENIIFQILEICTSDKCLELEQYYIDKYRTFSHGYNGRPNANSNLGHKKEESTKQLLRNRYRKIRDTYFDRIYDLYLQNKTTRDISKVLGISRGFIQKIFTENKLVPRTVGFTRRKKITQYDLNGKFIREWSSIRECSITLNINKNSIRLVLNKTCKHARGYYFEYSK